MFLGSSQNVPYIIKYEEIEIEETVEELKKKYYDNQNKLSLSDQLIRAKELKIKKKNGRMLCDSRWN